MSEKKNVLPNPDNVNCRVVIGIDPSFTRTGLAVLDVENKRILSADSFTSPRKKEYGKSIDASIRITIVSEKILKYLKEVSKDYEILVIGIESPSYGKFTNSSMAETGGLYYSILHILIDYIGKESIVTIRPKSVKMIATGNGNSDKEQVKSYMSALSDCKFKYLDESDAAAIALTAYMCFDSITNNEEYSNKITEAINKVLQE